MSRCGTGWFPSRPQGLVHGLGPGRLRSFRQAVSDHRRACDAAQRTTLIRGRKGELVKSSALHVVRDTAQVIRARVRANTGFGPREGAGCRRLYGCPCRPPPDPGLEPGDAHVIRNVSGLVTEDVLRSLLVSQYAPGTRDV